MRFTRRLRHALVRALQPVMLRIRGGPLKGLKWSVVSGSRFVLGQYETPKAEALLELVSPGDTVCDVGAHTGYFTAIAALAAGPGGHVFAFEPRPLNYELLDRHVRRNGLTNVTLFRAAVGERTGTARFEHRTGTGTGHLSPDGPMLVDLVSLDELHAAGKLGSLPDVLKIDVEGGETGVLAGARRILEQARPRMVLATHGPEVHRHCVELLESLGYTYRILPSTGHETELVALPGRPA